MELTKNERVVLLTLEKSLELTQRELAEISDLKIENAMQSAFMLEEKGLVDITE